MTFDLQSHGRSTSNSETTRSSLSFAIVLVGLFILGLTVRLVDINKYSFDSDETFSVRLATTNASGLMLEARSDKVHPPLYYLALRCWIALGSASESWVRSFSVLGSILGLVALLGLCRQLELSISYTAFAVAIAGASDFQVFYADHARMYSWLSGEAALSILLLDRWLRNPSAARWFWFSVSTWLLVTTHYFGWLVVAAQGLYLLFFWRPKILAFCAALAPALLTSAVWTSYILFGPKIAGEGAVADHLVNWLPQPTFLSLAGLFARLSGGAESSRMIGALLSAACGIAIVAALVHIGRTGFAKPGTKTAYQLLFTCILPPLAAFCFSHITGLSIWHQRYLIIVSIPYLAFIIYAVSQLPDWPGYALAGTILLLSVGSLVVGLREPHRKLEWSDLAGYVATHGPHDEIVVVDPFVENAFTYYLSHYGIGKPKLEDIEHVRPDPACWIEYNAGTWKHASAPPEMLRTEGFKVGTPYCIATPYERDCVFQVWAR